MNQESWNKYIIANSSPSSFLQSWEWGEFQATLGNKVERIALPNLQAQVIVRKLPFGKTYLEVPKGPVIAISNFQFPISNEFEEEIRKTARKEKAVFVRVNPPYDIELPNQFREPKVLLRQMEPERTILVNLTKSEDEPVVNMH